MKARWRLYILIFLAMSVGLVWYIAISARPHDLRFVMLNIGQGDALYIESPTGAQIIVDGGPGDALLGQVGAVVPIFDRSIDMLINTNPDRDHFEGFLPLLDRYAVNAFVETGSDAESNPLWRELEQKLSAQHISRTVARKGQHIDIGGGAYIDIIFPDRDVKSFSHNDASIIARLTYGSTSVLLTGDTTQKMEKYVVGMDPSSLTADILKIAHHGSKTSTSEELVQATKPLVAVISAGLDNQFGHPHQETLDTLEKYGVPYLVTSVEGRIEFRSDGKKWVRVR